MSIQSLPIPQHSQRCPKCSETVTVSIKALFERATSTFPGRIDDGHNYIFCQNCKIDFVADLDSGSKAIMQQLDHWP